ncbi:hypothetical protein WJX74_004568 [Apatococcus lobatus]|uniref:DM10 domain-containing protein n=1 Tax=Apatococcus lobatus TaxID=904363 RepID=A0AAW1RB73_9CHLO
MSRRVVNTVPFLPGSRAYRPEEYPKPKPQLFRYRDGIPIPVDQESKFLAAEQAAAALAAASLGGSAAATAVIGSQPLPASGLAVGAATAAAAASQGAAMGAAMSSTPQWVTYDKKVLRFYAFFKEGVDDSPEENYRVRRCQILLYLEDGSLSIVEPKEDNSGLFQGTFLKRHKVVHPSGLGTIGPQHIAVDSNIEIYARTFHVIGCDAFTREFMQTKLGKSMGPDMPYPSDPHSQLIAAQQARDASRMHRPISAAQVAKAQSAHKFFSLDRKVLEFNAYWDDTDSLFGDVRLYKLQYYLSDDTLEIVEVLPRNCGRDPFPKFLRRMRLPKVTPMTGARPPTVEERERVSAYNWQDLGLGTRLRVFDRTLVLYDCDEFTREWGRQQGGLQEADFVPLQVPQFDQPYQPIMTIPPNVLGIGSDEDTLQNVYQLTPKPPRSDFNHFVQNDGKALRFGGRLLQQADGSPVEPADLERKFVISYHLAEDMISIFEPPFKTLGFEGGKFLERCKLAKPGTKERYRPQDLYLGARLVASGRLFELQEVDMYTLKYMEAYRRLYPMADSNTVVAKLRANLAVPVQEAAFRTALISPATPSTAVIGSQLQDILAKQGIRLAAQEIVTLARLLNPLASSLSDTLDVLNLLSALGL